RKLSDAESDESRLCFACYGKHVPPAAGNMHRRYEVSPAKRKARSLARGCLLLAAFVCVMLVDAGAAFAQDGRQIETIDWIYHIPLALGCVLFVVAVDAFVIIKFVQRDREE
ncbi:MAG: hypothetical protein ACRDSJ_00080, partial [Rubrobacteraceae bacterium]